MNLKFRFDVPINNDNFTSSALKLKHFFVIVPFRFRAHLFIQFVLLFGTFLPCLAQLM